MSDEQGQDSSPLMPIEQQTIMFYSKPLVVVRLPDGRPGIVLRHLCDLQGYLKVLKEERKEPFFARMSKNLMISESEE